MNTQEMPLPPAQKVGADGLPDTIKVFLKDEKSRSAMALIMGKKPGLVTFVGLWSAKDDGIFLRASENPIYHSVYKDEDLPGIRQADALLPEVWGFGGVITDGNIILVPETQVFKKNIPASLQSRFEDLMKKLFGAATPMTVVKNRYGK